MFDLSLLIGLPKPNSLDTSSLTPEDAAIKLRQAATLRLNGAQSILLHFRKTLSWQWSCWMTPPFCTTRHSEI